MHEPFFPFAAVAQAIFAKFTGEKRVKTEKTCMKAEQTGWEVVVSVSVTQWAPPPAQDKDGKRQTLFPKREKG